MANTVISASTQKEMYEYILSIKHTNISDATSNNQDFLKIIIKELARKLYLRTELYIGKMQIRLDSNGKLERIKNYKCNSNKLIFQTLHDIKNVSDFSTDDIKNQLNSIEPIIPEETAENGSKDRIKLIKACKLYYESKEIEEVAKNKSEETIDLEREAWLAEKCLSKYTLDKKDTGMKARQQRKFESRGQYARVIKPDLILYNVSELIVIDIKVYSKILEWSHGRHVYSSNTNRFQVNSYIGKCIEDIHKHQPDKVQGVLLHIVNNDLMTKSSELQNTDLTIENDRPIKLFMIEDKGLEYIFSEYDKLLSEVI